MELFLTIILFCAIFIYVVLYYEITPYNVFVIRNNRTGVYEVVKVISKNIFYVTLSYTNDNPKRMLTIIFMIKTLFNI